MQATRPVVGAVADRRPVWWMFAALTQAMGRPGPGPDDSTATATATATATDEQFLRRVLRHSPLDADEVFAAGPRGVSRPTEHGWVRDELLADGRWNIAPALLLERLDTYDDPQPGAFLLAPRREMAWSNSIAYGADPTGAVVHMHPADAPLSPVTLATDHGAISATVAADPTVRRGVVSISHGHADVNPGDLTSGDIDVDPLTAMPRAAGVDVQVDGPGPPRP